MPARAVVAETKAFGDGANAHALHIKAGGFLAYRFGQAVASRGHIGSAQYLVNLGAVEGLLWVWLSLGLFTGSSRLRGLFATQNDVPQLS